jgi:hypothetical protein
MPYGYNPQPQAMNNSMSNVAMDANNPMPNTAMNAAPMMNGVPNGNPFDSANPAVTTDNKQYSL